MRSRKTAASNRSRPKSTDLYRAAQPNGMLLAIRDAYYRCLLGIASVLMLLIASSAAKSADPLPSWNDGAAKSAIVDFVTAVTTEGGPDFVPADERIATFDNDGTLWIEQPMYTQLAFALDRVKALASQHPEWTTAQPFKAVLDNDLDALLASGEKGLVEIIMATHAGNTTDEFSAIVADWIATARHPKFKQPYTKLVYQPMLEVLAFLRANGFRPTSCRAEGSSSCARGARRFMASRRSR